MPLRLDFWYIVTNNTNGLRRITTSPQTFKSLQATRLKDLIAKLLVQTEETNYKTTDHYAPARNNCIPSNLGSEWT